MLWLQYLFNSLQCALVHLLGRMMLNLLLEHFCNIKSPVNLLIECIIQIPSKSRGMSCKMLKVQL